MLLLFYRTSTTFLEIVVPTCKWSSLVILSTDGKLNNFHCYRTDDFPCKRRMPEVGLDLETSRMAFRYFTFGAACSEVEIDCLTGDHEVSLSITNS